MIKVYLHLQFALVKHIKNSVRFTNKNAKKNPPSPIKIALDITPVARVIPNAAILVTIVPIIDIVKHFPFLHTHLSVFSLPKTEIIASIIRLKIEIPKAIQIATIILGMNAR